MTPLARVMAAHFIGMERLLEITRLTKCNTEPVDIIGELEWHKDNRPEWRRGALDNTINNEKPVENLS